MGSEGRWLLAEVAHPGYALRRPPRPRTILQLARYLLPHNKSYSYNHACLSFS